MPTGGEPDEASGIGFKRPAIPFDSPPTVAATRLRAIGYVLVPARSSFGSVLPAGRTALRIRWRSLPFDRARDERIAGSGRTDRFWRPRSSFGSVLLAGRTALRIRWWSLSFDRAQDGWIAGSGRTDMFSAGARILRLRPACGQDCAQDALVEFVLRQAQDERIVSSGFGSVAVSARHPRPRCRAPGCS